MPSIAGNARRALAVTGFVLAAAAAGCGSDKKENTSFTLASNDVASGGTIDAAYVFNSFGCTGGNASPELHWSNVPAGTKSFALEVYDPDAPTGSGFWHWIVFDLPASATSIARGAGTAGAKPGGGTQGYTDFGANAYGGPCPPASDAPHHYQFTLYALNVATLGLPQGATGALVGFAARAAAIGTASFTATYGRGGTATTHPDAPLADGFTLSSAEVPSGGTIPAEQIFDQFGCTGGNVSPSLQWTGAPSGTKSFVLTVYDPDAPTGSGFWHWLVFDIPASATSIPKGAGTTGGTPGGGTQAYTDYGIRAYGGPCPPAGAAAHHYVFTLYALNIEDLTTQGVSADATGGLVGFATRANALARATFTATYGR